MNLFSFVFWVWVRVRVGVLSHDSEGSHVPCINTKDSVTNCHNPRAYSPFLAGIGNSRLLQVGGWRPSPLTNQCLPLSAIPDSTIITWPSYRPLENEIADQTEQKRTQHSHSPNIHKWKHTYLLTFQNKSTNRCSLWFKCRSPESKASDVLDPDLDWE